MAVLTQRVREEIADVAIVVDDEDDVLVRHVPWFPNMGDHLARGVPTPDQELASTSIPPMTTRSGHTAPSRRANAPS